MSQYSLTEIPTKEKYQQAMKKTIKEFEEYFGVKLNQQLCLIFLNSRQQFDDIMGRKTLPFETGYSSENLIFMMSEDVYEKESNKKFNPDYDLLTLRHEVCHKYFRKLAWTSRPVWLNEGMAIYLSGQFKFKKKVEFFKNFLLFETSNFINGHDVYQESGFVIEKLINKFGKEKILKLIESCRKINDNNGFLKSFKSIYDFELNYDNINQL